MRLLFLDDLVRDLRCAIRSLRKDLRFAFVAASGMRWDVEARDLRWSEVYWSEGQIKRKGKNDFDVVVPITSAIREILEPLRAQHPD